MENSLIKKLWDKFCYNLYNPYDTHNPNKKPYNNDDKETRCKSATTLRTSGTVILVLAIIVGIIAFLCTVTIRDSWNHEEFNPMSLVYLSVPILLSIVIWAFARAVADITENIYNMANKKE